MIKQLVVIGVAVMTTLLGLVVLWQFRQAVFYVLISLTLAATVRPLIIEWQKYGFARRLVLALFYGIVFAGMGFLVYIAGKFAMGDIQQLVQAISVQGTWNLPPWLANGSSFQQGLIAWLPTPDKLLEAATGEQGQFVLPAVLSFTEGIGGLMGGMFLILILSVYWTINQVHFERLWLSLLPSELRKRARGVWRAIELDLGAYIRSEIAQSLLAAFLLGLGYLMFGSKYPILLALVGALAWVIPVVGVFLALIPPLLIGLLTSLPLAIFTSLYTLIVLVILQMWVEPRLFKSKWDNPILTLVILLAMADAFGIFGILVAPPLSAICKTLWDSWVNNRVNSEEVAQVSDLRVRQAHLWTVINEMEEQPPPLVISGMNRLAALLEKAGPVLPEVALEEKLSAPFHPSQPVNGGGGQSPSTKS